MTVRATAAVSGDNLDAVRRELRTELPGQTIQVTYSNNSIFLRGTVKDLTSSARAVQIASTAGKVVNLLNVTVPKSDPQILLKVRFASVDRSKARQLGHQPVQSRAGERRGRSLDRPVLSANHLRAAAARPARERFRDRRLGGVLATK